MNVATRKVLYNTKDSHAAEDVLNFFKFIDVHAPKRSRWHLHFTPRARPGSTSKAG